MDLVKGYAGASTRRTYQQVVDNSTPRRFRASDRWASSTSHSAANYGTDHKVLESPQSVVENASYKISTPAKDSYAVYGWWPADPGFNDHTVFAVKITGGWAHQIVNQRTNGGRWIYLGTYSLGLHARASTSAASSANMLAARRRLGLTVMGILFPFIRWFAFL
jgi:hypothetical protein